MREAETYQPPACDLGRVSRNRYSADVTKRNVHSVEQADANAAAKEVGREVHADLQIAPLANHHGAGVASDHSGSRDVGRVVRGHSENPAIVRAAFLVSSLR